MKEKILIEGQGHKTNGITTFFWTISALYAVFCIIGVIATGDAENFVGIPIAAVVFLLGKFFAFLLNSSELVVTDKRVYGKTAFGKRVDLPLDSISAVSTGIFKRISVATSAGEIHFYELQNREEVHECINKLLIQRQNTMQNKAVHVENVVKSDADELKKYKELLDTGVITQEEFDAKKKQLLGL